MNEKVRRHNKERILIPTLLDNLRSEQKIMHTSRQFQRDLNEYFDVPVLVVSVSALFVGEVVLTVRCWHSMSINILMLFDAPAALLGGLRLN